MTFERNSPTIYLQNERMPASRTEKSVQNPQFFPSTAPHSQKRVDRRGIFPLLCKYRLRFGSNWVGSEVFGSVFRADGHPCFIHREAWRSLDVRRTRPGFHLTRR